MVCYDIVCSGNIGTQKRLCLELPNPSVAIAFRH